MALQGDVERGGSSARRMRFWMAAAWSRWRRSISGVTPWNSQTFHEAVPVHILAGLEHVTWRASVGSRRMSVCVQFADDALAL